MNERGHHHFTRYLEATAERLRARLGIDEVSPLDPFSLAGTFDNVHLFDLSDAHQTHPEQLATLEEYISSWSAMAFREGDGPWLVTWNPWHHETRVRVSLVEELSHIHLNHKPTAIVRDPLLGVLKRTYEPSKEKQAYGLAGATVAPLKGLLHLLRKGFEIEGIASQYKVSQQLIKMRLQVTKAHQIISTNNQKTTRAAHLII